MIAKMMHTAARALHKYIGIATLAIVALATGSVLVGCEERNSEDTQPEPPDNVTADETSPELLAEGQRIFRMTPSVTRNSGPTRSA